ncbi:MAG: hypothetical protein INR69_14920 [Mucilaginibacter polytrichastri]|nr:hypothetical protein [Mucilaginibacter polytrichastri]
MKIAISRYLHFYDNLAELRANRVRPEGQRIVLFTLDSGGAIISSRAASWSGKSLNNNAAEVVTPNDKTTTAAGRYVWDPASSGGATSPAAVSFATIQAAKDAGNLVPYSVYNITGRGVQVIAISTTKFYGHCYFYNRTDWAGIAPALRLEVRDLIGSDTTFGIASAIGGGNGLAMFNGFGEFVKLDVSAAQIIRAYSNAAAMPSTASNVAVNIANPFTDSSKPSYRESLSWVNILGTNDAGRDTVKNGYKVTGLGTSTLVVTYASVLVGATISYEFY